MFILLTTFTLRYLWLFTIDLINFKEIIIIIFGNIAFVALLLKVMK